MSTKRVTLADVAARAGVSKTAVSLILNNRPGSRLSDDAVARVHEAAEALRYRPNPAARSLRLGRTTTIGFISDEVTVTRFASAMIRGLLDVADEHDHGVLIAETGQHPKRFEEALEFMIDRQVEGIAFGSLTAREIDLRPLPPTIRTVGVNCTSATLQATVLPAEEVAGRAIAESLLNAGHRRIAIIGNAPVACSDPRISVTIPLRLEGIDAALRDAGVEPVAVLDFEEWEPWHGYDATSELLRSGTPFTALICLNDRIAFGAQQALQKAGLEVPDDVSIASFDDDEIASYMRPGLTTARLDYEQMGRRAMELLLGPDTPAGQHLVPMGIQVRGSVAPLVA